MREQAFILPVLTEKPRMEHRKTHTVAEKSDKNAIFESFSTMPLPRESIIFPPPAMVPDIIITPTGTESKRAEADFISLSKGRRIRQIATSFCPS